ncbi:MULTISPECIES: hypothetical protein [unclassified Xanthobacter]|uniref:hypothetical protein n=1 Tax=unclassified Xanthobacter TaxID=2623496 RepID=UPI001EE0CCBB|nr:MULTISPECIES: hypothetical protein [unclassified Xanthobacter]
MIVDAASVVALLAALVPLALFWALLHRRSRGDGSSPHAARPQAAARSAIDDVGRDDVEGGERHPTPAQDDTTPQDETTAAGGAAAAAAGGAVVLGYDLARRAEQRREEKATGRADQ